MQDKILPMLDINPASATLCADPITNEVCQHFNSGNKAVHPFCWLFVCSLQIGYNNKVKRCDKCLTAAFKAQTYAKIKELESCLS